MRRYDWSVVAKDLLAVYEMVTTGPAPARVDTAPEAEIGGVGDSAPQDLLEA